MINALAAYNRSHSNFKDVFKEPLDYVEEQILIAIKSSMYEVYIPLKGADAHFEWYEEDWEKLGGRFIKGLEELGYRVTPFKDSWITKEGKVDFDGLTISWDNPCI